MDYVAKLKEIKECVQSTLTQGLLDSDIKNFVDKDKKLQLAIDTAYKLHKNLKSENPDFHKLSEEEQIKKLQADYVNFYDFYSVNPYIPIAAYGPWIVTTHGAVIHDSGGYGMLGFGHAPKEILKAMNQDHVMANIMTPSLEHVRFTSTLRKEVGCHRQGEKRNPFKKFMCLNSGSEAVTIAARISDLHARKLSENGAEYEGRTVKFLTLKGSFHGRTDRPAQFSDSCVSKYREHLASFHTRDNLTTIEANSLDQLENVFNNMDKENVFYEALFMEPVMGEGNPGLSLTPEFYQLARKLCHKYKTLLVIDSIQAGLRARGCLSIVDYPGFETLDPPDMETYSKSLNAGQYPLSILALGAYASDLYITGLYGNTMTSNPRALGVASAVLKQITPSLRKNIVDKGQEFLSKLDQLKSKYPNIILKIQGTGLLFAVELDPKFPVVGKNGIELEMRKKGIGVIHGGTNALRFTPHFAINSMEVDLIISVLDDTLNHLQS